MKNYSQYLIPLARYLMTALVGGLTAAYSYYPHANWIPVALGIAGTIGIHAVPAIVGNTPKGPGG